MDVTPISYAQMELLRQWRTRGTQLGRIDERSRTTTAFETECYEPVSGESNPELALKLDGSSK